MGPQAFLLALQGHSRVLLTGPIDSDGDSLGASLALARLLRARGFSVDVAGEASYRYQGLPGVEELLTDEAVEPCYDAVVILDGDRHRLLPKTNAAFSAARLRAIVDHHASTERDGYDFSWIEPHTASTCEMIFRATVAWGEPLNAELGALLYTGMIFDTGAFRYSNTRPETHEMARVLLTTGFDHAEICVRVLMERQVGGVRIAGHVFSTARFELDGALAVASLTQGDLKKYGVVPGDLEGVVDGLVYTRGVEVAALLTEKGPGLVKASFRSRGKVDMAAVAGRLSPHGGGHHKAAGAAISMSMDDAIAAVLREVAAALPRGS